MCFPFDPNNVSNDERKAFIIADYKQLVESAGFALLHGGTHVKILLEQANRLESSMKWGLQKGTFNDKDWQSMLDAIKAAKVFCKTLAIS